MHPFLLVLLALVLALAAQAEERVVAYEIIDAREIPASLTGGPGDPQAGRALYFDDKIARCAGCHGNPEKKPAEGAPAPSAPALSNVGSRLDEGAIRLWLVAPEVIRPGTPMPGYYSVGQRDDPADPRFGEPLLTAVEIEHLVAYLADRTGGP